MWSSILAYALLTSPIGDTCTCTCKTVKLVESASYCVLKLLTTVPNPNWELWFAFFSKNTKFIFNNNKNKQRRKLWVSCNNHSGYLVVKPFGKLCLFHECHSKTAVAYPEIKCSSTVYPWYYFSNDYQKCSIFHYKDNYLLSLRKFFCRLNHNCLTLIFSSLFVNFGQLFLGLSYPFLDFGQLLKIFLLSI